MLTTPVTIGALASPLTVSSLQVTDVAIATKPSLAQIGTGTLAVTLTDPNSGAQETIIYQDATVLTLWASTATVPAGQSLGDTIASAVFNKLIADGKLPAGTVTYSTSVALAASTTNATPNTAITLTATLTSANSAIIPSGNVTFFDGGNVIATITPANGIATYSTANFAAGSHSITANLAATTGLATSNSAPVTITIS